MKRILIVLLTFVLTLGCFAGCGDKKSSESEQEQSQSESEMLSEEEGSSEAEMRTQIEITSPKGEVYPYIDAAREYLESSAGSNVSYYLKGSYKNQQKPVILSWESNLSSFGVTSYKVEYSLNNDYSSAITVEVDGSKNEVELFNLFKASRYFVRVTGYNGREEIATAESEFTTTDLGPRVMNVDGINNVRDVGGYITESGKRTVQGLLYRGGTLTPSDVYRSNLTEEGKRTMSEVMGIRSEFDFRSPSESGLEEGESVIPNASLKYFTLNGYSDCLNIANAKRLFSALAVESNYPIYYHCTGGADRTGTVTYLINALLGVSEDLLIKDYEFTSFSIFGERNTQTGGYANYFQSFRNKLLDYEGETLQQKVESWLLAIGVTQVEINNIKAIMLGEEVELSVLHQAEFVKGEDDSFKVYLNGVGEPTDLKLDGNGVAFTVSNDTLTVLDADMPQFEVGDVEGRITLANGKTVNFTFKYRMSDTVELNDYMPFGENDFIELNSLSPSVEGSTAVGYGKTVRLRLNTVSKSGTLGGIYILVGSYGIYIRGGEIRLAQRTEGSAPVEAMRNTYMPCDNKIFDGQNMVLELKVDLSGDKPVITVGYGTVGSLATYSYTFPSRIGSEIASENAKVYVGIRTDAYDLLTIKKK